MRRGTVGSTIAVLLAGGALGLASAAPASAATCSRLPDIGPTGSDPADAVGIRTTAVSCSKAKALIPKYVRRSVSSGGDAVRVGAFTCRERTNQSTGRISVRCTASGSRSVRWKFG